MTPEFLTAMRANLPPDATYLPFAPASLRTYNKDFLTELINRPVVNECYYKTTLGSILDFLERCGCEIVLRGSATLKLLGLENLKNLADLSEIPQELETFIQEQINAPLNDVDIHIILPTEDASELQKFRGYLLQHLSMSLKVPPNIIESEGLKGLLTWRGLPEDRFEIITLAGGVDLVFVAKVLSRPHGVFARDVAITLNGRIPVLNDSFGGGKQSLINLFARIIRPSHPKLIGINDWARALLYLIKGYDIPEETHEALVCIADIERSLELIRKRHFVHSEEALPIYNLQALITLQEMNRAIPSGIEGALGINSANIANKYSVLQAAAFAAYAKGSENVSLVSFGSEKLRVKIGNYSIILKTPTEPIAEPRLTETLEGRLALPRATNLVLGESIRNHASRELFIKQTSPGTSQIPRMILEGAADFEWVKGHPCYAWLNVDPENIAQSIFESLLHNRAYITLFELLAKYGDKKLKGAFIPQLYRHAPELAIDLYLGENPSLKSLLKVHRWVASSERLKRFFYETALLATTLSLTLQQETDLVQILKLFSGKELLELLEHFSHFNLGYEFAQLCEEHLTEMYSSRLLTIWENIKEKFTSPPPCVARVLKEQFKEDPEATYLSDPHPKLLKPLIKGLLSRKEYTKALKYALELKDQATLRAVAKRCPPSAQLVLFLKHIEGDTTELEIQCRAYLPPLAKTNLLRTLLVNNIHDDVALQLLDHSRGIDLNLIGALYLRLEMISDLLALFVQNSTWSPSAQISDHLAEFCVDQASADRLYTTASNTGKRLLENRFVTSSETWFCRFCEHSNPSIDQVEALSIPSVAVARRVYKALKSDELKVLFRNKALQAGILLPGTTPNVELLELIREEQLGEVWKLCRSVIERIEDYPRLIPHMPKSDILSFKANSLDEELAIINRLLKLKEFSKALDYFIKAYRTNRQNFKDSVKIIDGQVTVESAPNCTPLNKLFLFFLRSEKLSSQQLTKIAEAVDPVLCYKEILYELFLKLSKTESNDRYIIEILDHFIYLLENNQSDLLKENLKNIKPIVNTLVHRVYLSKNKILLNKLVDLLLSDTFVKLIFPKDITAKTPSREQFFYLLHLLISRCSAEYIERVSQILDNFRIKLQFDDESYAVAAHYLLIAAASGGNEGLLNNAVQMYFQCLEAKKCLIPPETGVHSNAIAIVIGYSFATDNIDVLIKYVQLAWRNSNINILDIQNTIRRIYIHERFENIICNGKISPLIITMCKSATKKIISCERKEYPAALEVSKTLLLMIMTLLPTDRDWIEDLYNMRAAPLQHKNYPQELQEAVTYIQMLGYPLYQQCANKTLSNGRMGLDIIKRLLEGPTTGSLCFALLHMGLNLQFMKESFGDKYSQYLGCAKYHLTLKLQNLDVESVTKELAGISTQLGLEYEKLAINICLLLAEINLASYKISESPNPITVTDPLVTALWTSLAKSVKQYGQYLLNKNPQ